MKLVSALVTIAVLVPAVALAQNPGRDATNDPGATPPCVGTACTSGGMATPPTAGGVTATPPGTALPGGSVPGTEVPASPRPVPSPPRPALSMTQDECLNGGWERAGFSSAAACFSAPGVRR